MGWSKFKPFALAGEPTSATLILSRDAALGIRSGLLARCVNFEARLFCFQRVSFKD